MLWKMEFEVSLAFGVLAFGISSRPPLPPVKSSVMPSPILELTDVKTHFPIHHGFILRKHIGTLSAVDGVTLTVGRGEVVGLVGESGCGKSTFARTIMQLVPTSGANVLREGKN